MDLEKAFWDLIWVGLLAVYLTGLIGCAVYLRKHPTDSDGKPWVSGTDEAVLFAVMIAAWPALLIAKALDSIPRNKER